MKIGLAFLSFLFLFVFAEAQNHQQTILSANAETKIDSAFKTDSTYTKHIPNFMNAYNSALQNVALFLPSYQLGFFCRFEDDLNAYRKLRIDFGSD